MVITRLQGKTILSVRGPESKPTRWHCPEEGEWLGIRFNLGTLMPQLPPSSLVDQSLTLPNASETSFWLNGVAWDFPDFENADFFVRRLVHDGLLMREPGRSMPRCGANCATRPSGRRDATSCTQLG